MMNIEEGDDLIIMLHDIKEVDKEEREEREEKEGSSEEKSWK